MVISRRHKNLNKIETIIKCSSYSESLPTNNCIVKVAIKKKEWANNNTIKTEVYNDAIYNNGFVSIDDGETFYLASNFLFHKLKRNK